MNHDECGNLFGASRSLLKGSGLVQWNGDSFVCNGAEDDLEQCWKDSFDPQFGRYMAWVWFSVGAENLAKAALACHDLVEKETKELGYPVYPGETDHASWVDAVLHPRKGAYGPEEAQKFEYGTLGCIWNVKLDRLSRERKVTASRSNELKAAYKYLAQAIRNRDAHSYVENKRRRDFSAVGGVFVAAFNTLVEAMKDKGHFNRVHLQ